MGAFVEAFAAWSWLIVAPRDDGFDATVAGKLTRRVVAVAFVAGELRGPSIAAVSQHAVHCMVELRRFVRLARRECGAVNKAVAVSNQAPL